MNSSSMDEESSFGNVQVPHPAYQTQHFTLPDDILKFGRSSHRRSDIKRIFTSVKWRSRRKPFNTRRRKTRKKKNTRESKGAVELGSSTIPIKEKESQSENGSVSKSGTVVQEAAQLALQEEGGVSQVENVQPSHVKTQKVTIFERDGAVLWSYSILERLLVVQEKRVRFWGVKGSKKTWVNLGKIDRVEIVDGILLGRHASFVKYDLICGLLYVELWKSKPTDEVTSKITLEAVLYFISITGRQFEETIITLEDSLRVLEDVKFLILDDLSLIVFYNASDHRSPYKGTLKKYIISEELDEVCRKVVFDFAPSCLSHLMLVGGDRSCVLGLAGPCMYLWNHRKTTEWRAHRLVLPPNDEKFASSRLLWNFLKIRSRDKTNKNWQADLCILLECETNLKLEVVKMDNGQRRTLCQFSIPEPFSRVVAATMIHSKLVVAFSNGIVCWNLHNYLIEAESEIDGLRVDLSYEHAVIVKSSSQVLTVPIDDCVRQFTI